MAGDHHLHFSGTVAQKAVIEKDDKVLIVRDPGGDSWDLPGGRIHVGERPADALARELQEELGANVTVGKVFFADMWMRNAAAPADARYFVAFACKLTNPEAPFVLQEEEIAEVKWIGKEEVHQVQLYDICKRALGAYFAE